MFRFFHVLVLCCSLAACGNYRPLYGTTAQGTSVVSALADITIPEQKNRSGQLLRNELLSSLSPAGSQGADKYRLVLVVTEKISSTSSSALTKVEQRRYRMSVSFQLLATGSGDQRVAGQSFSDVSFDRIGEPISDLQAERNAMSRAASELAGDVKLRLSAYFSGST